MRASASDGEGRLRILVTGATGTVGRRIVDELIAGGHTVRALTRTPESSTLPAGVEVVAGDLADPGSLGGVFDGIDAAHLFAVNRDGVDDPDALVRAILERACDVRRLTVLDGVGTVPLAAAVLAAGGTRLGPVEFMANARWWTESIKTEGVVREAMADAPSTVVHEADIAAVAAAVLVGDDEYAGQTLTITGPEALTLHERCAILAEVSGRPVRVEEPSREEMLAQWRGWGLDEETIEQFLAWSDDPPEDSVTPADTVERVTGRPGRTFRQWASENADRFR